MRDRDIRAELRRFLEQEYTDDALILDELGLCQGEARVDMVVINGALNGYEIKSERDTLQRLEGQIRVYGRTLDSMTIVVGPSHLDEVMRRVPDWWGVMVASPSQCGLTLNDVRPSKPNPALDPYSFAQLLWRDEAWDLLVEHGLQQGLSSRPRPYLWRKLADSLSWDELSAAVRHKLAVRDGWRSASES
ncbi:MAG: sce7726 family protein [Armatimonadetes bacterium]|nr:sce7726 family protein [Armatimonadota bacterium]